jgi:hypothetical protein
MKAPTVVVGYGPTLAGGTGTGFRIHHYASTETALEPP